MTATRARSVRRAAAAAALLVLCACAGTKDADSSYASACTAQGLTPGTDLYTGCVQQQQLQQESDLDRIRQLRESARGSSRL